MLLEDRFLNGRSSIAAAGIKFFFCAAALSLTMTGCRPSEVKTTAETMETAEETTAAADSLRMAEELLQGEWQFYDKDNGIGENFTFDHGDVSYYWYWEKNGGERKYSQGTYKITDDQVITTINGYESYFDYEIRDGKSLLSKVDNQGKTHNYFQTARGEYRGTDSVSLAENQGDAVRGQMKSGMENASSNTKNATSGEKNALNRALAYLRSSAFSYDGLVEQLEYEGVSHSESVYGADNCGADWNGQALKQAKSYLQTSAFSYKGLVEQLEYEGYTSSQAEYGVEHCGADWNEEAVKSAKNYLSHMSFSKSELIEQLEYEGFTRSQAEYGVNRAY